LIASASKTVDLAYDIDLNPVKTGTIKGVGVNVQNRRFSMVNLV
jgi:hypothetical protein